MNEILYPEPIMGGCLNAGGDEKLIRRIIRRLWQQSIIKVATKYGRPGVVAYINKCARPSVKS